VRKTARSGVAPGRFDDSATGGIFARRPPPRKAGCGAGLSWGARSRRGQSRRSVEVVLPRWRKGAFAPEEGGWTMRFCVKRGCQKAALRKRTGGKAAGRAGQAADERDLVVAGRRPAGSALAGRFPPERRATPGEARVADEGAAKVEFDVERRAWTGARTMDRGRSGNSPPMIDRKKKNRFRSGRWPSMAKASSKIRAKNDLFVGGRRGGRARSDQRGGRRRRTCSAQGRPGRILPCAGTAGICARQEHERGTANQRIGGAMRTAARVRGGCAEEGPCASPLQRLDETPPVAVAVWAATYGDCRKNDSIPGSCDRAAARGLGL